MTGNRCVVFRWHIVGGGILALLTSVRNGTLRPSIGGLPILENHPAVSHAVEHVLEEGIVGPDIEYRGVIPVRRDAARRCAQTKVIE